MFLILLRHPYDVSMYHNTHRDSSAQSASMLGFLLSFCKENPQKTNSAKCRGTDSNKGQQSQAESLHYLFLCEAFFTQAQIQL